MPWNTTYPSPDVLVRVGGFVVGYLRCRKWGTSYPWSAFAEDDSLLAQSCATMDDASSVVRTAYLGTLKGA